jgi:hypothetical protein
MNLGRRKSPAINSLGQGRLGPPSSSSPSSPAGNVTRLRRHSTLGTYVARRKATCAFSTVHNNNSVSTTTTAYVVPYIHIYSRSSLTIHTLRSLGRNTFSRTSSTAFSYHSSQTAAAASARIPDASTHTIEDPERGHERSNFHQFFHTQKPPSNRTRAYYTN